MLLALGASSDAGERGPELARDHCLNPDPEKRRERATIHRARIAIRPARLCRAWRHSVVHEEGQHRCLHGWWRNRSPRALRFSMELAARCRQADEVRCRQPPFSGSREGPDRRIICGFITCYAWAAACDQRCSWFIHSIGCVIVTRLLVPAPYFLRK